MNSGQLDTAKLTCVSCRKKRKIQVQLTAYQLNPSLGIFMCNTVECVYPLNTKNLHKFVYKISPSGEYQSCDPCEVPNLKDLFALLSSRANPPDGSQTDALPSPKSSDPPSDTPQIVAEVIPKKEQVKAKLPNLQSKTDELVPREETCESYGAKFGTSSKVNIFPIWENKDALCWLDSTLCLLVHSKNLKTYFQSETFGECQLKDISIAYDEAVSILNSEKRSARAEGLPDVPFANLEKVRERTFNFLQPFQKCEKGQEDSPVFAIMVLLKQNKYLHSLFLLHFLLELKCEACGYMKITHNRKTLVTIPGNLQDFSENQLIYLRPCFQCQQPDQKIALKFVKLPPLLLMHFVEGLPHSNIPLYDLVLSQRGYCVRGFVQYREPERHFITWVRDGHHWMCCDDLNPPVQRFEPKLPDIAASEIHIVMWEQKEINGEDNFHLHYSGDENCNDSLSSLESASPPLIILDDSDSETETGKSQKFLKPLRVSNEQVRLTNDIKTLETTVSTADKQQEEMVNDNSLPSSSKCKVLSSFVNRYSISKELNHVNDSSVTSALRQGERGNLSDGQGSESYHEEQEDPVQNKSPVTLKDSLDNMQILKLCSEDCDYDSNSHSDNCLISSDVCNQNISGTDGSCLSKADESQPFQFSPDSKKQDKDVNSTRSAHTNVTKNDKSVKQDEDINSKSSSHINVMNDDDKSVNRQLETVTRFVGSHDICEKNQEDKLNLGESSFPLLEKRSRIRAGCQRKVHATKPSNITKNDKSVKQDEDINSKSSSHSNVTNDDKSVNRQLETVTDFIGSHGVCEKNQEDKLNLGESSFPLPEKRSRIRAGCQRKVHATKPSNIAKNDKSVKQDEDINSKSSAHINVTNGDDKSVKRQLETVAVFIGSHDICEKNQEDKLNLGESGFPLPEKRSSLRAGCQRKVYAPKPSSEIRQIFKQETVCEEQDAVSDQNYDEMCRSVRECYVAVDRLKIEAYTKTKLGKRNIVQTARPLRRGRCAQASTENVGSSSVAPAKCREQGGKRKAASLLKQCSFDGGLQDANKTAENEKLHGNRSSSSAVASISAIPDENFPKEQKSERVKSSALESPAPGHVSEHSSNLSMPETESKVCPDIFPIKRKEQDLDEISQKVSSGKQQNITVQNNISDCSGTNVLSSGSLSVKQSENSKDVKNKNLVSLHDGVDTGNIAPSELSVISDSVTELNNKSQSQGSDGPNLPSVHSVLQVFTDLSTLSKTVNTCGSPGVKLHYKKSSPSDLSEDVNCNVASSDEVFRGDVSTVDESKGSTVSAPSCEEGCTCDLCSVRRFLQNNENRESEPQALEKASETHDMSVFLGSSETSTSVAKQTEQDQKATIIAQNRSHSPPKKIRNVKSSSKDILQSETNSDPSAVHNKMPSRKCPASRQIQRTATRKISKETANKCEHSQEPRDDQDLNASQVSEENDSGISVKYFKAATSELPEAHEGCKSIELGHSEQANIVSPEKKHKTVVKTQCLFKSSVQGNLNQSLDMASSPTEQEEVRESVEKQVTSEQVNKRVMYKHFGRQSKLCVGNAENNNDEAEVQHGESDPCRDLPVSKRGKQQRSAKEGSDISHPTSAMTKKLKRKCNKLSPTGRGYTFLGDASIDDSAAPKRKVELKFEPDSVQFVEVPVDCQSSDTDSVKEDRKGSEMPQAVNVELKNSSMRKKASVLSGSKKGRPARNVIKYKGITAVFEPFVEDDVTEFSNIPAMEKHISFNGISSSHSFQSDASEVSSCGPEKQDVVGDTNLLENGVDASTPVFDSVDLLRAHLCSESNDSSEQTISGKILVEPRSTKRKGKQTDVPSIVKRSKGNKKLHLEQKENKKGKKKNSGIEVLDLKKTAVQRPSKQKDQELHCDTAVQLGRTGTSEEVNTDLVEQKCEYSRNYLTSIKRRIHNLHVDVECHENQRDLCTSQDLFIPSESPAGNKEVEMDTAKETEEKNLSPPCQIQDHNDVTKEIPTGRKGKKAKTVRFSFEPSDNTVKPGRKKIKDTSASESSVLQRTVHEKAGIRSTVSQEVGAKKKNTGTSGNQKKKVRSKSPASPAQDDDDGISQKQGHQSSPDKKPVIIKVKQGNLLQDVKSTNSNNPLSLMNPFMFFPKDLTLNSDFSVSVPRPQVTKITVTPKGAKSSEIG